MVPRRYLAICPLEPGLSSMGFDSHRDRPIVYYVIQYSTIWYQIDYPFEGVPQELPRTLLTQR